MSRFILVAGVRPNMAARVAGLLLLAVVVLLLAVAPADACPTKDATQPGHSQEVPQLPRP